MYVLFVTVIAGIKYDYDKPNVEQKIALVVLSSIYVENLIDSFIKSFI